MPKEISFLNSPFTFTGINNETFVVESSKNLSNCSQTVLVVAAEDCNVINVDFNVGNVTESVFYDFLSNVWRLGDTHW